MAGRGRGIGRGMSFNVESLGFGRGEALPGPILQPPPVFPVSIGYRRYTVYYVYAMAMAIRRAALHISSVAMLIRRAALHTSSVAMLIRRAVLHISSVKMAYLQSIHRTSTCSKSNISQRRRNR